MNQETKEYLLKKGIEQKNFPDTVYKYRTIKQMEMILDNFSFWFANPNSFNDPFDCNLSEINPPNLDDAKKHLQTLNIKENDLIKALDCYEQNPTELTQLVETIKEKTIFSKGVLSLSEKYDDILMWSHYSDYHKGVVIGLSMDDDIPFFVTPIKIDYKNEYEILNYLSNPHKSIIDTLKIKSSHWQYENEIRIYKDKIGLQQINKKAIVKIYFGIKTSNEDIDKIKTICKSKNLTHIKFYKGHQSYGSFEIKFELI